MTRACLVALLASGCSCEPWSIGGRGPGGGPSTPSTPPPPTSSPESLDLPGAGTVEVGPSCALAPCPPSPAWDVVVEWRQAPVAEGTIFSPPAIAHLDDDDADGKIGGRGDTPEVLFVGDGQLSTWRGDGAVLRADYPQALHPTGAGPAVGDVDGDGLPEIVVVTGDSSEEQVVAMRPDGTVLWTSEPFFLGVEDYMGSGGRWIYGGACQPTITDLEGDGAPEVFCDLLLLDGATGETRWKRPMDTEVFWVTTTVADLDLDGVAEIVTGNRVLRADGTLWWEGPAPHLGGQASYPAAVNLDADPEGEVLFVADGKVSACDTDGTVLWTTAEALGPGVNAASAPCVADFDGDGALEVAAAFMSELALFELDGTRRWTRPVLDGSSAAACFGFDFDLDGRAELAYADEETFSLVCGGDGGLLYEDPAHQSGTYTEFPLVADLDGDGGVEVLVGRSGAPTKPGPTGFVVYGQRDGRWPGSGEVWPQQDYQVVNMTDDGTPDGTVPSWLAGGGVRSRPADGPVTPTTDDTFPGTDLGILLADQLGSCNGLALSVQVRNAGAGDAPAGRVLEVWALDAAATGEPTSRLVRALPLPAIPSGVVLAATRIDLVPDEIGDYGVELKLRPEPGLLECDPDDEQVVVELRC